MTIDKQFIASPSAFPFAPRSRRNLSRLWLNGKRHKEGSHKINYKHSHNGHDPSGSTQVQISLCIHRIYNSIWCILSALPIACVDWSFLNLKIGIFSRPTICRLIKRLLMDPSAVWLPIFCQKFPFKFRDSIPISIPFQALYTSNMRISQPTQRIL